MTQYGQQNDSNLQHSVCAWAPASISNLGPGFDCLGLAIENWGDLVEAKRNDVGHLRIFYSDKSVWTGSPNWEEDTAGVAARAVLDMLEESPAVDLTITKNVVPGSGVGTSAASAAAGAWAVNLLFGSPLSKVDIVPAVLKGEALASGSIHGDNALPALFGGITVSSSADPRVFRQIQSRADVHFCICLPHLQLGTREARSILPDHVALKDSVRQASSLALLVSALADEDWAAAGRYMMTDELIEPLRAVRVPGFAELKRVALEGGAYGFALSGSGPAVFAATDTRERSSRVLEAMMQVVRNQGVDATGMVSKIETEGARRA